MMTPYCKSEILLESAQEKAAELRASGEYRHVTVRKTCREWHSPSGRDRDFARIYVERKPFVETPFAVGHEEEWMVQAAWGDWHEAVPAKHTGVMAVRVRDYDDSTDALKHEQVEKRWFVIPKPHDPGRGLRLVNMDHAIEVQPFA